MANRKLKLLVMTAFAALLATAVAALAGVGAASTGHGKHGTKGTSASAAEYQYGTSGGKQYGLHKMPVCHNGHTLLLPAPAVQAHVRHGDVAAACPSTATTPATPPGHSGNAPGRSSTQGASASHGNDNADK